MITKPTISDPFGYDDSGRPVAVKLTSSTYAFGDEFCQALQALMKHGCRPVTRLFSDGGSMIFIFHPASRKAEMWSGGWKEDEPGVYSILNPERKGLLAQGFYDFDTLLAFAERDLSDLKLVRGRLPVPDEARSPAIGTESAAGD